MKIRCLKLDIFPFEYSPVIFRIIFISYYFLNGLLSPFFFKLLICFLTSPQSINFHYWRTGFNL